MLRPYQKEAVEKLLWSFKLEGNDICVFPTGAGKSHVIAEVVNKIQTPTLILQPSVEILHQNYEKLSKLVSPDEIGVYSASAGKKEIKKYTFATIQSIYKKPEEFVDFKFVIIDECHRLEPNQKKSEGTMFSSFLHAIGNPKVIGFTATPYRLSVGYKPVGNGKLLRFSATKLINRVGSKFWKRIVYCINGEELFKNGFLTPLTYVDKSILGHDNIPVNKSGSDFDLNKFSKMVKSSEDQIFKAIFFTESLANHILVFCSSVEQAKYLSGLVDNSDVLTADTRPRARAEIVEKFKFGYIKTLFNVGVLTVGFDFPELDGIILLRPTKSIALYYQMLGRGLRPAINKRTCHVVDLSGTVKELGRVESIKLVNRQGWELESETCENWNNKPLYTQLIDKAPTRERYSGLDLSTVKRC